MFVSSCSLSPETWDERERPWKISSFPLLFFLHRESLKSKSALLTQHRCQPGKGWICVISKIICKVQCVNHPFFCFSDLHAALICTIYCTRKGISVWKFTGYKQNLLLRIHRCNRNVFPEWMRAACVPLQTLPSIQRWSGVPHCRKEAQVLPGSVAGVMKQLWELFMTNSCGERCPGIKTCDC